MLGPLKFFSLDSLLTSVWSSEMAVKEKHDASTVLRFDIGTKDRDPSFLLDVADDNDDDEWRGTGNGGDNENASTP